MGLPAEVSDESYSSHCTVPVTSCHTVITLLRQPRRALKWARNYLRNVINEAAKGPHISGTKGNRKKLLKFEIALTCTMTCNSEQMTFHPMFCDIMLGTGSLFIKEVQSCAVSKSGKADQTLAAQTVQNDASSNANPVNNVLTNYFLEITKIDIVQVFLSGKEKYWQIIEFWQILNCDGLISHTWLIINVYYKKFQLLTCHILFLVENMIWLLCPLNKQCITQHVLKACDSHSLPNPMFIGSVNRALEIHPSFAKYKNGVSLSKNNRINVVFMTLWWLTAAIKGTLQEAGDERKGNEPVGQHMCSNKTGWTKWKRLYTKESKQFLLCAVAINRTSI